MRMIILAAGQGTRLRPLTDDKPKCLVELAGKPLLAWQIETARAAGISDITVIGGYRQDALHHYGVPVLVNERYQTTNMVRTLFCAQHLFGGGFVMSYGDIVYSPFVLSSLLKSDAGISIAVDRQWHKYWAQRFDNPLSDAETLKLDDSGAITEIGQKPSSYEDIMAQYIGLAAFRGAGVSALVAAYEGAEAAERDGRLPFGGTRSLDKLYMTDLLQGLIADGKRLQAVPIDRGWVEVDSPTDLAVAERIAETKELKAAP
jgi:choline kinase